MWDASEDAGDSMRGEVNSYVLFAFRSSSFAFNQKSQKIPKHVRDSLALFIIFILDLLQQLQNCVVFITLKFSGKTNPSIYVCDTFPAFPCARTAVLASKEVSP